MCKPLAIIIPAYKDTFLRAALDSIATQTCQDFTLYIGDDCSPYDIGAIVDEYKDKIDHVYHRFETNLGGKDLVAQWERCIAMSKDEPYIWLFSDDDIMESRCVEEFYKCLNKTNGTYDLYHFNVKIINDEGQIINIPEHYPQDLDNFKFYKGKMRGRYASLVVENIFTRNVYEKCKGFKNFDLAWGSDTATWVLFSERKGFHSINNSYILWRSSNENISPNLSSEIVERKVSALLNFLAWAKNYFESKGQHSLLVNTRAFISRMTEFHHFIPEDKFRKAVRDFCKTHRCQILYLILYSIIKNRRK